MKKVLHVISDPARRGAQVFATQLAGMLSSGNGGPDGDVVALADPPGDGRSMDVPVLGPGARHPRTLLALRRRFSGSDVVVAHGSTTLQACAVAALGSSTPWVYRNIGDPTVWGDVSGANLRIGAPLRRAHTVVALYDASRRYMVERYHLDADRVVTIPNAVPAFVLPTVDQRGRERSALGLDEGLGWVAFIGSLTEEKGILDAVRAIAADPELGLVVAGDGAQRAEATELAERVAPGRVRFLGVTDRPLGVMAAVDVLVIPSRTEGLPGVAIEAGLSALPVVATSVGGVPELVVDGVTGVLVDRPEPDVLVTAIHTALADSVAIGAAARAHCEAHYVMESVAPRWAQLLKRIVDERR